MVAAQVGYKTCQYAAPLHFMYRQVTPPVFPSALKDFMRFNNKEEAERRDREKEGVEGGSGGSLTRNPLARAVVNLRASYSRDKIMLMEFIAVN